MLVHRANYAPPVAFSGNSAKKKTEDVPQSSKKKVRTPKPEPKWWEKTKNGATLPFHIALALKDVIASQISRKK